MFLRVKPRFKVGKEHRYWSIVENRRTVDNQVVQRHVLYLGEINDGQQASWIKDLFYATTWLTWRVGMGGISPIEMEDKLFKSFLPAATSL
jgi:hypothetical protein